VQFKIVDQVMDFATNFEMDIQYKKRGFITADMKQEVDSLISLSTELLLCLIEGNDNQETINKIIKSLKFDFMKQKLTKMFEDFVVNDLQLSVTAPLSEIYSKLKMRFPEHFGDAFNIYQLIVML